MAADTKNPRERPLIPGIRVIRTARIVGLAAVEEFGRDAQIEMVIEEAAEFIVEMQHSRRNRPERIEEELADLALVVMGVVNIDYLAGAISRFRARKEADNGR